MKKLIILIFGLLILCCEDIENCETTDDLNFIILRFFDLETGDPKSVGFRFNIEGSDIQYVFAADTTIIPADTTFIPPDTTITDSDTMIVSADTIIIPEDTTIVSDSTIIGLPLDPNNDFARLIFTSDSSQHIIELSYDPQVSILDSRCPPSLTFTDIDTLSQTFDSLAIVGRVTNRLLSANVEIYF